MKSSPRSPQLEKKPAYSNEDPMQAKINKFINLKTKKDAPPLPLTPIWKLLGRLLIGPMGSILQLWSREESCNDWQPTEPKGESKMGSLSANKRREGVSKICSL